MASGGWDVSGREGGCLAGGEFWRVRPGVWVRVSGGSWVVDAGGGCFGGGVDVWWLYWVSVGGVGAWLSGGWVVASLLGLVGVEGGVSGWRLSSAEVVTLDGHGQPPEGCSSWVVVGARW